MYKISEHNFSITEKVCTKVSNKSIFYIGRNGNEERELISTNYTQWHSSKEEAVEWLRNKLHEELKRKQSQINHQLERIRLFEDKHNIYEKKEKS